MCTWRTSRVASRRTRESSREQRPTPAGARLTGRLGFHSLRPSKPPLRNVEHDRGESSGSAALAARRAGNPSPEQMARKMLRNVEKRGVHAARNGPSEDRKCWRRVELGIHCLNRWTVNCQEKSEKRGVQATFKVTKAERGHLLSGAREALLAPNVPFAAGLLLHVPCRRPEIEAMRGRKRSTRRFAEPLNLRKTLRTFSPIPQFPQTRSFAMNFIGVDLHKKSITISVMDEKRKILARKTVACTQPDEILEFFRQFRPFKVVVEATASYVWFV